jgi:hypothetical protein
MSNLDFTQNQKKSASLHGTTDRKTQNGIAFALESAGRFFWTGEATGSKRVVQGRHVPPHHQLRNDCGREDDCTHGVALLAELLRLPEADSEHDGCDRSLQDAHFVAPQHGR